MVGLESRGILPNLACEDNCFVAKHVKKWLVEMLFIIHTIR